MPDSYVLQHSEVQIVADIGNKGSIAIRSSSAEESHPHALTEESAKL